MTTEKITSQKTESPVIRNIPKSDHWISDWHNGGSDSTVSEKSHNKTATKHNAYDEAQYSDVSQYY